MLLSIFFHFVLAAIFDNLGFVTAAGDYFQLVRSIQKWQDFNPNMCGRDTKSCGIQNMVDQFEACKAFRIVNGCPVGNHATYGWQVGVNIGRALCSGTLLSPQHVSLAAHCVQNTRDASDITVFIGAKTLRASTSGQRIKASQFAAHPKFERNLIANDAAIIELSGYGIDNYKEHSGSGTLRYAVISISDDARCARLYGASQFNPKISFCASGTRARQGSDSCGGDSGSGVMCKDKGSDVWRMYGIVSYGTEKCATVPGVYADAFNLGLQASAETIQKAQQGKQDSCSTTRTARKPARNNGKQTLSNKRPKHGFVDSGVNPGQKSGSTEKAKKIGGIDVNLTETVRLSGCTNNSECRSNVCRPVEVCSNSSKLPTPGLNYRQSFDFEVVDRPAKQVNETEANAELQQVVKRQTCSKVDICWLSAWVGAYSPTEMPLFDFEAIAMSGEDEIN